MKKTRLKHVSSKRREANKKYAKLRLEYLSIRPICFVCKKAKSTDIHHIHGRTGTNFLDMDTWLPTCRKCHDQIHKEPRWARENGYLPRRAQDVFDTYENDKA